MCYFCLSNLDDAGNYRSAALPACKDQKNHPANFCSSCFKLYESITEEDEKPSCYICEPFDTKNSLEECGICREEIEDDIFIWTRKCNKRPYHRIKVCVNCAALGENSHDNLNCKFCTNRKFKGLAIF